MAGPGAIGKNNNQETGSIQSLTPELQRIYYMALAADKKPLENLEERKSWVEERTKLLTDILGKVENTRKLIPNLNSPFALREMNVASGDDKIISGTADKSIAEIGKHNFEVLELASGARALSNRFEDKDRTQIGSGYFTFNTADGQSKEVFIDNQNSTLEGIARIINSAGMGVKASVINDQSDQDEPFRLLLTASGVGTGKDVEFPEFYFVDGDSDFYIDEMKSASNAKIRYQGLDIESPTNEIKDIIPGVTLNLKGLTGEGKPIGISVEQDIPKTTAKIKDLVDKLNEVFTFIQGQNKMDENTPTYKTLGGDYTMRLSESRLRNALQGSILDLDNPRSVRILQDLGVTFNKHGTLEFDAKKFENAINNDFEGVAQVLTGDIERPGVITKLSAALNSMANPGVGLLTNQKQNYQERINKFNAEIDQKEKKNQKKAEDLKEKLARIQGSFNKLQGQGSFFSGMGQGSGLQQASSPKG